MNILVVVCAFLVCDTLAIRLKREEKQEGDGLNPSICGTLENKDLNENEFYPWLVGFGVVLKKNQAPKSVGCLGSLITRKHIILPAHCIMMNNLTILFLGNTPTDKLETIKINKYKIHENFNYTVGVNDVGLVTLEKPLEMSVKVHPICLPLSTQLENKNYAGQEFEFARLCDKKGSDDVIEKIKTIGISKEKCKQFYNKQPIDINNGHLCVQTKDKLLSRLGNSGAPVMTYDTKLNRMSLIAYLTFGLYNDDLTLETSEIATRITPLTDWIRENSKS